MNQLENKEVKKQGIKELLDSFKENEKNELENEEAEKQEIKELLDYFADNKMNPNDQLLFQHIIEKKLIKIMKMELDNLDIGIKFDPENTESQDNDITLSFKRQPDNIDENNFNGLVTAGGFRPAFNGIKPNITIHSYLQQKGLQSDDPKIRMYSCEHIFYVLFHELRHYKQYLMAQQQVSSKENLAFGRDFVLASYMYDFYKDNYDAFAIENDANLMAGNRIQELLGENEFYMRSRFLYEGELNTGRYKYNEIDEYGKRHTKKRVRDDAAEIFIDYLICDQKLKQVFDIAPILNKEYNSDDFTKKTLPQLLTDMKEEQEELSNVDSISEEERNELLQDSKEMYYEIIFKQLLSLKKGEISNVLKVISMDEFKCLLEDMKQYFDKENKLKVRKAEKMYMTQRTSGEFPSLYFVKKNPLKKFRKKSKRLDNYYDSKKLVINKVEEFLKEIEDKTQEQLQQRLTNDFKNYLKVRKDQEEYNVKEVASMINKNTKEIEGEDR